MTLGFLDHALECLLPAFVDDLRHLRDFAAHNIAQARADRADETERMDRVPDDQFAWRHPLEVQAVDFISRKSCCYRHDVLLVKALMRGIVALRGRGI